MQHEGYGQLQNAFCEPMVHSHHWPKLPRRSTLTGEDNELTHNECYKMAQTQHRQAEDRSDLIRNFRGKQRLQRLLQNEQPEDQRRAKSRHVDAEGLRFEAKDQRVTGSRKDSTLAIFGNLGNRALEVQPLPLCCNLLLTAESAKYRV